jgi:hypothetical protein
MPGISSAAIAPSCRAWMRRIPLPAVLAGMFTVAATPAHAVLTVDDCPCRRAATAPATVAHAARPSMLAIGTTPGAGLVMSSATYAARPDVPPISAGRIVGETFAGALAGAVGGAVTAYVAYGAGWGCTSDECTGGVVAVAFVAYSTIIAAAVTGAGNSGDQHVPFRYPFLGALAGGTLGTAAFVGLMHGSSDGEELIALGLILPLAGAVAGRRWDPVPVSSLRVLPASTAASAWDAASAPGPLPGTRIPLASVSF